MACKNREEIVGKRFLSVSHSGKLKFSKITDWEWRSGVVRAASHKDPNHPELTVLVEFDDVDWKSREWFRLYQDNLFDLFLVEYTLVWTLREESDQPATSKNSFYWPSLTFKPLVDKAGLEDNRLQPIEYLVDQELGFVDYAEVLEFQEEDEDIKLASRNFSEVQKAIKEWTEYQDGQRILVTTPSVLTGYRVEVYRVEGTTQWYTAVIISYNDSTQELTLTDDTVLEEHSEDPCLVQMKLIGDGVVESILRGENIGITPRRRACANQQNAQVHYCTRTRSHYISSSLSSSSTSGRNATHTTTRKPRGRNAAEKSDHNDSTSEKAASHSHAHDTPSRANDRRKRATDSELSGGHRKNQGSNDSRKRASRQKRASSHKDLDYVNSIEEEVCKPSISQATETQIPLSSGQSKPASVVQGKLDASNHNTKRKSDALPASETLSELNISRDATPGVNQNRVSSKEKTDNKKTDNCSDVKKSVIQKSEPKDTPTTVLTAPSSGSDVSVANSALPTPVVQKCDTNPISTNTGSNVKNSRKAPERVPSAISDQAKCSEKTDDAKRYKLEKSSAEKTKARESTIQKECEKSLKSSSEKNSASERLKTPTVEERVKCDVETPNVEKPATTVGFTVPKEEAELPQSAALSVLKEVKSIPSAALSAPIEESKPAQSAVYSVLKEAKPTQPAAVCVPKEPKLAQSSVYIAQIQEVKPAQSAVYSIPKEESKIAQLSTSIVKQESKPTQSTAYCNPKEESKPIQSTVYTKPSDTKPTQSAVYSITKEEAKPSQSAIHKVPKEEAKPTPSIVYSAPRKGYHTQSAVYSSPEEAKHSQPAIYRAPKKETYPPQTAVHRVPKNEGYPNQSAACNPPKEVKPSQSVVYSTPKDELTPHQSSVYCASRDYNQDRKASVKVFADPSIHLKSREERKHALDRELSRSASSADRQKSYREIKREPESSFPSNERFVINEANERNAALIAAYQKANLFRQSAEPVPEHGYKYYDSVSKREGHHASFHQRHAHLQSNAFSPGMPFVDKTEGRATKEESGSSHLSVSRAPSVDNRTTSPRSSGGGDYVSVKERGRSDERKISGNLHNSRNEPQLVYRDPVLVNSGQSTRSVDCYHQGLMHPAGISHSGSAVFPRVALPQQGRSSAGGGANTLHPPLDSYNLNTQLMPAQHVGGTSSATSPGSHLDQHAAAAVQPQAFRHLLSQHHMIPPQYGSPVGMDVMWQQKYPNPWLIAQYEESMRLERERAIAQERERNRMERDRRDDMDRFKAEKDKERERYKDHQQKHELDERERAKREVHQHFEESLRLALQKQQQQQQLHKSMGWNLPLCNKSQSMNSNSPLGTFQGQPLTPAEIEKEKERMNAIESRIRHEHEKWLASVHKTEQQPTHPTPYPPGYSCLEPRTGISSNKSDMFNMSRMSPHSAANMGHHSNKPGMISSPAAGGIPLSQQKSETNFSLYGYQPFQHTYITHAQLKAREDSKALNSMQSNMTPGSKQLIMGHSSKHEKEMYERSATPGSARAGPPSAQGTLPKHHLKVVHHGQDRSSHMYQPLVGSGGAFKPYEYSNSSPAPPAHQNSSSPTSSNRINTPHQYHHAHQEQPENLVKSEHKVILEQPSGPHHNVQRYEGPDARHTVSTPPCSVPASYTPPYSISKSVSPAPTNHYSYSLIQQGLVPNPLYIASTQANVNSPVQFTTQDSKSSPAMESPPAMVQYSDAPASDITSGIPVCRPNAVSYLDSQAQNNQMRPQAAHMLGHPGISSQMCPQEAHIQSRLHIKASACRSPSPAHIYVPSQGSAICPNSPHNSKNPMCTSPRGINQTPMQVQNFHRTMNSADSSAQTHSTPETPLNLQSGFASSKRKYDNDTNSIKRQKSNDEHHYPLRLPSQGHSNIINSTQEMIGSDYMSSSMAHSVSRARGEKDGQADFPVLSHHTTDSSVVVSDTYLRNSTSAPCADNLVSTTRDNQQFSPKPSKVAKSSNFSTSECDSVAKLSSHIPSNVKPGSSACSNSHDHDDNRTTVSPASSAGSTKMSCSTNYKNLKKAWLQRHSENEDKKIPCNISTATCPVKLPASDSDEKTKIASSAISSCSSASSNDIHDTSFKVKEENKVTKLEAQGDGDSTSSASEMEAEETKHGKRKLRISRKHAVSTSTKKPKNSHSGNVSAEDNTHVKTEKDNPKKKNSSEKEATVSCRRRGRKTKGRSSNSDDHRRRAPNPPVKPSIAHLKKTGEAFLQDGPCCDVAPRLPKCRECRMTPHQRNKKMPNIFCRFYAYRKLKFSKSGTILSAGFSEPSDAGEDDLQLWLPPLDNPPTDIEVETSKFLLTHVGDQFCCLVEMEKEAQTYHMCDGSTVTWKRVVQGVREMCDVCETTLFNIHWVCHKCGFVVCIDCYKTRKDDTKIEEVSPTKDRDAFHWLFCSNKQPHEQGKLMPTQIIPNSALWDVSKTLHEVRRKWNIPTYCNCSSKEGEQDNKHSTNGICKLMNAVAKCFSSDKESSPVNGIDSPQSSKRSKAINGQAKPEETVSGYSSESAGSPLSWLADVALNSSGKLKGGKKNTKSDEADDDKSSDNQCDKNDEAESDDERNENFSTLRELLIRPMGKMSGKNTGTDCNSQKTLTSTLDEVISCVIEQRVRKSDKKCKEKQLLHFTRKHQTLRSGRELLPIRSCMLTETSLLYPEIPHIWLGNGKILELTNPYHSGNLQMFQEQWKRGQPVLVARVGQRLNASLWHPESFIVDFGDNKGDLVDCLCGTLLQNQPMKKFWEGFANPSKRMKADDGTVMVLKLKDWPPSEEFSDVLPSRYQDLVKVLPLQQYTHRDGLYNMASRLPECFVHPDLGPRMYNAYGFPSPSNKGSTNLHLDISDAVNVLAYVEDCEQGANDITEDVLKTLDSSGCDSLMKKRAQDNMKVGAIWHVYNARDADKIRDLLNKISEEQGTKCDPHHDPIHTQEWYMDEEIRERLYKEYGVEGYVIVQCMGDAIFIPAGSPHQVQNLKSCIKISEDFVSPESVGLSFFLTQEVRNLSCGVTNNEERLQIKNIIYHAVKDALALLQSCDPEDPNS